MRYSTSFMLAIFISFFLFLGMSMLIQNKSTYQSNPIEIPSFNMIEEIKAVEQVQPDKPIIPEKQEVKQPPDAPDIDMQSDSQKRPTLIDSGKSSLDNLDFTRLKTPIFPGLTPGLNDFADSRELVQISGVQPVYPQIAMRQGIEGWVKVEILVNELGLVSHVKILDANPKRIFDQTTIRAMLKSKYQPMVINGKKVAQSAVQVIEFKIDKD